MGVVSGVEGMYSKMRFYSATCSNNQEELLQILNVHPEYLNQPLTKDTLMPAIGKAA